jgi:hypothetical protein
LSCAVQKQGRDLEQEAGYLILVKIEPLLKPSDSSATRSSIGQGLRHFSI